MFLFGISIFGLHYLFVWLGLMYSPPIWLAFFRALFGFIGAAVLLLALRVKGALTTKQKLTAMLLGVPGTALFFGLWFSGGTKVLPGLTSVIIYTFPLWMAFLSILVLKEKPKPLKIGGVLLGFFGVALASLAGFSSLSLDAFGLVELAAAGFCFAFLNVAFKKFFKGEKMLHANVWQLAGSLLPLAVWAALSSPFQAIQWTPTLAGVILWIGVLGTAVTFFAWFWLLSRYNASSLGGYSFLSVVVAVVSSVFLFGEQMTPLQAVGTVAILASIYLVSKA